MRRFRQQRAAIGVLATAGFLLASCNLPASTAATVWLDVPTDGLTFPKVQEIKIEGHASGAGGVSRVEIWINGTLLTTIDRPPMEGELAAFHTAWAPTSEGVYTIQVMAFSVDGVASPPDSAVVTFGGETPTIVAGCPSPVGGGPTPVSCEPTAVACPSPVGGGPTPESCPAGPVIEFWAEPPEIRAGECTDIRWHAENVEAVVFGGISQPLDGSYDACLCENERYTLRVMLLDGTEEQRTVDVAVSGSCETPVPVGTTPPPPAEVGDTTPPPTPEPAVPANGLTLGCRSSQNLAWLPVSDDSGIAEYRVQVQRHGGDNNWQDVPGSVFAGIGGKESSVEVECGWYYRWRVRAVDGAGNVGSWSGWSEFAITLP